jgi:hypothetical protein
LSIDTRARDARGIVAGVEQGCNGSATTPQAATPHGAVERSAAASRAKRKPSRCLTTADRTVLCLCMTWPRASGVALLSLVHLESFDLVH